MFEAQVVGLLQRYLGKYVYGLDAESLKISVWRGDVELRNLRLKPEALVDLNLPVTVKSGLLGRLTLKVPWSKLGKEPVVAEFDRLYLVACPREDDSHHNTCPDSTDPAQRAAEIEAKAKQQRVSKAEDAWLEEVAARDENPVAASNNNNAAAGGMFRALVDTIIGNLELHITNVHIRYEDTTSNPGHSFCIGIMLQEISGHTANADWQRAFVSSDALKILRKSVRLQSLAIYFDCDVPLLEPGKRWDLITRERWDDLLLPDSHITGCSAPDEVSGVVCSQTPPGGSHQQLHQHQFLLCPVDGTLHYVRRGKQARLSETDAEQEIHLQLKHISMRLHQLQYQSSQKLLQEFDRYAASAPHRNLRPHCRPAAGAGARLWWRYAITVVKRQQQTYTSRAWRQMQEVALNHKQYVPAYVRYLQQGKPVGEEKAIADMDKSLDESVILLFRRMAHAKYKASKAKSSAAESSQHQRQQQGWFGWLMGSGQRPPQPAAQQGPPSGDVAAQAPVALGVDEWNKLEEILSEQAAALGEDQKDTPMTVKSIITVQVEVAAMELQEGSGRLIMQAAMGGVDSRIVAYPEAQDVTFSVSKFGVTSSYGPLMSSGVIISHGKTSTAVTGAAAAAAVGTSAGGSRAMSLRVLRNPQDGSADLLVQLTLAPSYVTYNNTAIQDVVEFFKSEDAMELSRLQAQAAARTDKLRHMAQLQLKALSERSMEQKPRMRLYMTLHAPKIAVPDSAGENTLIADLGCFTIKTNTQASQSLSKEEAALYEAFVAKVDHVSAYLLDGPFAWPSNDELIAASAVAESTPAGDDTFISAQQQQMAMAVSVLQGLLARHARVVPLLFRFGLGMDLQVATSVHPRYPVVRLAVSASPLQLQLSPYRYQQLMMVLQSIAPAPPSAPTDAAASAQIAGNTATADKPLWMSEAEYMTKVSLLTWEGMGSRAAKWQSHRWLHVWRGRVYLTAHRDDSEVCLTRSYWMGYRVIAVQPASVGGSENVLAILPKNVKAEAVTESPDALIIRAADAATATELRKKLMASANQMSAVAGLLELGETDEQDVDIGTTKDVFDELFSHQQLLQLYGSISEVSLLISGRAPICWWPPSNIENLPSTTSITSSLDATTQAAGPPGGATKPENAPRPVAALPAVQPNVASAASAALSAVHSDLADGTGSSGPAAMLVLLEEEVDLVAIKFQGAQVGVAISGDGLVTEVAMAALTMDDLLVGARNPEKAHMTQSSINWNAQQQQQAQAAAATHQAAPDDGHVITTQLQDGAQTLAAEAAQPQGQALGGLSAIKRATTEDDEEFFDADDGDPSTPRQGRRRLSSGSSSSLSSATAASTVTSIHEADAANARTLSSGSQVPPPAAAALAAAAVAAGQPVQPSLQLLEGFGLDVDDTSFIAAPSFVSAMESFTEARGSRDLGPADHKSSHTESVAPEAGTPGEDGRKEELVRLLFARHSPTSSNYTGLDVEVVLKLSTLEFYCNRPTVAALMVFGTDLGAINTLLAAPADAQQDAEGVDAGNAAETATTTDSESVSDIQLVRGGGDQRTLFKLTLQVTKVALHLNYEGDIKAPLAIGSIDNFVLQLAVHPATLQLTASLGNLVAEYGALPVGHPNRVMVSMRDRQAGSLIEVTFRMHSVEDSFLEQRVPGGTQYMSVVTHMSTVQIVFMNKFLVEFLEYLAAMLAMQATPKEHPPNRGPSQSPQQAPEAAQRTTSTSAPTAGKPLVLLLDVELDAPVLLMPLTSSSEDHVEVDLGTLQLSNRVVWEIQTDVKQKLLMDEMQVTLQKVSGCVVEEQVRGRNVIREMGGGVNLFIRRALLADPLPLPPVTTAVNVPQLRASLLDTEYALILAVLSSNFGEAADIPRSIAWLHQQLLPDPLVAAAAAGAGGVAVTAAASSISDNLPTSGAGATEASSPAAVEGKTDADVELQKSVISDFSCTNASLLGLLCDLPAVKTTVSIGQAQLMLWNAQPEGIPPAAVGSIEFSNMWLSTINTHAGNMLLSLSLPTVCARDLRTGVPKEASLVLSTAEIGAVTAAATSLSGSGAVPLPTGCPSNRAEPEGGVAGSNSCEEDSVCSSKGPVSSLLPSLLTLDYRQVSSVGPAPVAALQVRLQRPTVVLDVGFIMKVLHFVAPTAGLQGPVPRPFETREVHLGPEPHLAPDHLWLSPEYRIIADAPDLRQEAVYDGAGHALVLPDSVPAIEHVPLIVVGRAKTLRFKNVRIINKQSLAGVLLLGPGARLIADEEDGVSWHGADELSKLRNKFGRHIFSKHNKSYPAAPHQPPSSAAGSMTMSVHAVGAAVYLVDAHSTAEHPASQDLQAGLMTATTLTADPNAPACVLQDWQGSSSSAQQVSLSEIGPSEVTENSASPDHRCARQAELLRMLAMYLDLGLDVTLEGSNADITAQLQGLCIKAQARMLEAGAGRTAESDDASAPRRKVAASQEVATGILEPCNVKVVMKQSETVQDLNIDVSTLQLRMSPDVMQLVLHLQQVVFEPLAVPPTSQPLTRVDKFSRLWCSHESADGHAATYAAAGAGGVDLLGSDKGVTVWRPQPPMGYAIVGDVLSAGHSQPEHQVVAIAINSGLVAYPTGYTLAWESPGVIFWRPVPPPGYVAMGCIATPATGIPRPQSPGDSSGQRPSSAVPPSRKSCVVVAKQAITEALLAECMMLCTNGNLWCIQNSAGTFEVAPPDSHQPQVALYDLRSPLGIAPYALTPLQHHPSSADAGTSQQVGGLLSTGMSPFSYLASPPSLVAARAFAANRATLRAKVTRSGQVTSTVEFARIWWDKHAKHPSMTKVSFWRPVPPPGYVILGDCMVAGMYCPPQNVLVVRDADLSETGSGQPPLLARPLKCLQVWVDGHKKARGDYSYLTLWKPLAPAGYVAMGLLASLGGREPASLDKVRCVRADMAARVDLQPSDPSLIIYPYKQRPGLGGWVADDRSSTFVAVSHDGSPQLLEAFRLKDLEDQASSNREPGGTKQPGSTVQGSTALQLSLAVGKTNLLLRNLLRTPILELEAANINVGLSREPCGVQRCFAYLTTSLWSYHQSLEVWEPIMEPWQLLLHMDVNPHSHSSAGIAPGTWIRLTSPQGTLHMTLAQAPLVYALDAMTDWQDMAEDGTAAAAKAKRQGLAATDGMTVYTTVNNTLGVPAYLQLDYGEGHKEVVLLQPHAVTSLTQPMPVPPSSHAPLIAGPPPPMRLVVDVLDGKLLAGLGGAGSLPELHVKIDIAGRLKQQLAEDSQGMLTRAVPATVSLVPSAQASGTAQQGTQVTTGQTIQWNERFVLALPPELAEQLLTPAPGDNPFEGVAVELAISVCDGSGDKGLGKVVGRTTVQVQYSWLLEQVQALLGLRQVSAGAASMITAAAAGGHSRALSNLATGTAAAATQLGQTYTLQLEAMTGGGGNSSTVVPASGSEAEDDALMQLNVAVSLDDSQVSSSWYPHQRLRRQLARVLGIASSSRDGIGKASATGALAQPGSSGGQQAMSLVGAASPHKHALRLEGSDVWSPFSYTSLRRLTGVNTGSHTGVVPIRAGQGLVMELSYAGGQYSARIRSLCQFLNSTDMTLEVALLEEDDSTWTVLPYTASTGGSGQKRPAVGDVLEEEVFEYERYLPLRGWSPDHLKGLDPHRYSRQRDGSRGSSAFPKVQLPQGWEWEGPWEVEIHGNVDSDGWAYAFEPRQFKWPPEPGAGIKKAHDFVRRRRLVRKRRRVALPSSVLDMAAAGQSTGASPPPAAAASPEQWQRRVIGRVQPGGSIPLPQDWRLDNKQLQLRPVLVEPHSPDALSPQAPSAPEVPSHAWSYGVSNGQHSVQLASMEDGSSRLLCCKTLGQTAAEHEAGGVLSPRTAASAAPSCWISSTCEANELLLQGGMDVLTDWIITAQPPLTLRNDLPVAAHYVLRERAARGGNLVLRQQGYLQGGTSVNVYSIDMRQQVCLTFHPEGAEWAEPEPVLVSEGCLGNNAGVDPRATQLPDSFCVRYSNSQSTHARLRIALNRHMDTELLDSQRIRAAAARATAAGGSSSTAAAAPVADALPDAWRMSYGTAMAQGRPLLLALSVPVWVVNGTQLPIAVGIVQLDTTSSGETGSGLPVTGDPVSGEGGLESVGQLRILDTEAYSRTMRPSSSVTIMGNSVELLSYPGEGPDGSGSSSQASGLGSLRPGTDIAAPGGTAVQQWAAVLSVMGSRWSPPLVLAAAGGSGGLPEAAPGSAPVAEAVARQLRYEPVVVRAKCKDGCVYEVTVRVESSGTGLPLSTVLRLDPHMVISNRTGYSLQLLQPEPIWKALGSSMSGAAGGTLSSSSGGVGGSSSSGQPAAWFANNRGSDGGIVRRGPPTAAPATPVKDSIVVLRPGSLAVPLSWPPGCIRRLLLLTLPPCSAAGSGRGSGGGGSHHTRVERVDPVMWSEPFRVEYPATGVMQVLLPLYRLGSPGEPQPVNAQTLSAAQQAFKALFQPAHHSAAAAKPPEIPAAQQMHHDKGQQEPTAVDNGPLLVHVAKRTEAGLLEYLAVTVNLAVEMPVPGCLHIVLQSLGGEPQHCLMNCTAVPISYRQATSKAAWQVLPPYSGAALVLLQPTGGVTGMLAAGGGDPLLLPGCSEVELRDSDPQTSGSAVCNLETDSSGIAVSQGAGRRSGGGGPGRGSGEAPAVFPIAGGKAQALAQVLPLLESVMAPAGPAEVPGAGSVSLGRTQTDRLLRVLPKTGPVSMNQLRLAACIAGQDQARLSPASGMHLSLELPSLDVSLVDGRPQELMLINLDGLAVEYHAGNSAGITYTQLLVRLNLAQIDDMLHASPFPVLMVPADRTVLEDSAADPLVFFTYVSQPSRLRGALYTPTIAGRIAALRLQVSETLAWRMFAFAQGLAASGTSTGTAAGGSAGGSAASAEMGLSSSRSKTASSSKDRLSAYASTGNLAAAGVGGSAAGGRSGSAGIQQVANADLPLQVDLLSLDDLPLRVSFRTDKSSRPRWANQMWVFNTLGDMLNFDDLQLTLPGLELEGQRAARSALIGHGLKQLQAQALAIVFNVFRSYGVLGTATRLLVVGSNITSAITGTSGGALGAGSASSERVGNIGQGFLEGGKTFGEGLLKGVTGIVADPLAGAKQGGVLGFMTGTVRGIVGVPGQIIGGALSAASKVTEGMDATYKEVKGQLTAVDQRIVQRRRLPRCIRGEGILAPYSMVPAMGLALLYNCGAGSVDSLVKGATGNFLRSSTKVAGKEGLTDSYETHMTLPNGNIAIITNMRLLMVQAEMFAQLETEVEMGRRQRVSGVPPGRLLWQLTWDQMLSAELAYHRQQPGAPPDGVIVHRKNRSEDGDVLVHDVRCNPNNNQALRLYEALSAARQKYYIQPRREAVGWKVTPVIAAEQQGNQEMPSVMLSMDFKRVWRCSRPGARPLSVWRPVGPPGYASLGDVAMPGNEPPARPVSMYRDTAQEAVSRGHTEGLAAVPALAQPERYQLVFRDSGSSAGGNNSAMSLWRPIAPNGYMEIGYVVVPAIEEPPLGIVRCMRSDLVKQARLFDYPVWSDTSSDNMYWLCSIWQVDNSCSTFVAAKSTNKPHQHTARAPSY